jgi:hypothetical protein
MNKPIPLPDAHHEEVNGEHFLNFSGHVSLIVNIAVGRIEGNQQNAKRDLSALATQFMRAGFDKIMEQAATDDQAMKALLLEVKVLFGMIAENLEVAPVRLFEDINGKSLIGVTLDVIQQFQAR